MGAAAKDALPLIQKAKGEIPFDTLTGGQRQQVLSERS
jgi:hypothetical protein